MTCKYCGKYFKDRYICSPWIVANGKSNSKFLGASGFAKANFQRHTKACGGKHARP